MGSHYLLVGNKGQRMTDDDWATVAVSVLWLMLMAVWLLAMPHGV